MNKKILSMIEERLEKGKRQYGEQLEVDDGREWLEEALEELLDAIVKILSNKERGNWSNPDFADLKALDLIWDDEWDRLK